MFYISCIVGSRVLVKKRAIIVRLAWPINKVWNGQTFRSRRRV